jgi:acyl-CoA synthetase (NDP forming)
MQAAYSGMLANDFDINFLILDFPHRQRCEDWEWQIAVDAFAAALEINQAKGAFVVGMPENISEDYAEAFCERGMVSFYGIDEALLATEIAADIGAAWKKKLPSRVMQLVRVSENHTTRDEASAKQQLSSHGVPVPAGGTVHSIDQALELAETLTYPVVMKALGIAHKSEQNGVRLNLISAEQVRQAAQELLQLSSQLYVETMIESTLLELIVGITRDVQFGLVLTIGSGGILVEILKDIKTLLIPATRSEIEQAITSLKSAPLLAGYRGKASADIEAIIDAILAIQDYAVAQSNSLIELDVNPLLIGAKGEGVFAADALIVLQEES